jgi:hypothetical protein
MILSAVSLGLGLVGEADAVAQHVGREFLDEGGLTKSCAAQPGEGAAGLIEGEGGARRGAEGKR